MPGKAGRSEHVGSQRKPLRRASQAVVHPELVALQNREVRGTDPTKKRTPGLCLGRSDPIRAPGSVAPRSGIQLYSSSVGDTCVASKKLPGIESHPKTPKTPQKPHKTPNPTKPNTIGGPRIQPGDPVRKRRRIALEVGRLAALGTGTGGAFKGPLSLYP